ncbi:MAG: hypothetical protein AB7G75_22900 [Candidatus Binatia bacterium]
MKFPPLDFSQIRTYPLAQRKSTVVTATLGHPWRAGGTFQAFLHTLPHAFAAEQLLEIVQRIATAVRCQRPVVLGMGAHPVKVGLSPLIIDLLERGIVSAVAMNGAGIVHDFELAFQGQTSEDVAEALRDGSFGMAQETGEFLNSAIREGVTQNGLGIGRAVGNRIRAAGLPYEHLSILAAGARLDIPISVHVAVGTDIIHMHPRVDGAALGEGSLHDFRLLTAVVAHLEDGVFINLGSAVIIPEIFLKTLSLARNLGHKVSPFTTVDLDFIRQYRPTMNIVTRPTQNGGKGFHLTGHHELLFPMLCAAIIEELSV